MAEKTNISWCDATFNPWIGCSRVSEGCRFCYAAVDTPARVSRSQGLELWGPNANRRVKAEGGWRDPIRWDRAAAKAGERRRVFCASAADVFEDWQGQPTDDAGRLAWASSEGSWMFGPKRPNPGARPLTLADVRLRLFGLIRKTPNLDWLILTKRPEGVTARLRETADASCGVKVGLVWDGMALAVDWLNGKPPENVWLGTSVEDQRRADERIPPLLSIPAAVRFLSVEPLLGPIDLPLCTFPVCGCPAMPSPPGTFDPRCLKSIKRQMASRNHLHWAIVGGEGGPDARPMHPDWARGLRDQCRAAGVAFHFKQWGEWMPSDVAPEPEEVPKKVLVGTACEATVMAKPPRAIRCIKADGTDQLFANDGRFTGESPSGTWVTRVGKKAAGRILDGRTWDELPDTGKAVTS